MAELGLEIDSKIRARKFIIEVLETNKVYYLRQGKGAEQSESNNYDDEEGNPLPIIPFWSKSYIPYARKWSEGAELHELSLEEFVKYWLKGMNGDGIIVGLNWDQSGIGYECYALDLLKNLAGAEELEDLIL